MAPLSRIVVLGDSVCWGQGLLPAHKFSTLVANALGNATTQVQVLAHSGAIIGVNRTNLPGAPDGEIPDSYPTILDQCAAFNDHPETVDLVLVDGGINDVEVRNILDPLTSFKALGDRTKLHCYSDMKQLLAAVVAKFPNPNTKIVVTGYFPILSTDSELLRIPPLLQIHGIALPTQLYSDPVIKKTISLCLQFWNDSKMFFGQAVNEANAGPGGGGRIRFAPAQFTEKNSVFASDPWLWGVHANLSPQDEVSATRIPVCNTFFAAPEDILSREQCYRASAGHPNVSGAAAFAAAIKQVLP